MLLCDKKDCTGCMACVNICPQHAISIIENEEGFLEPQLDENKCIKCKMCQKVCPIQTPRKGNEASESVYAMWTKDNEIRFESTSGGFFTEISKYVLKNNGIVFGAVFDENFKVVHKGINKVEDLKMMRGSKYVQSDISKNYKIIKELLEENRLVLFSGTPCQVSAIKSYLKKEYANFISVDIVCHGVPSPRVFEDYKKYIEKKYNSKIKDIKFRYKEPGWKVFSMKIELESGKTYISSTNNDPYLRGFLRDYYLRPSCSDCHFTKITRQGDFTCSDFWGYKSTSPTDRDEDKGISMVMVNTEKAQKIIEEIKENMNFYIRKIDEAVRGNRCLSESFPMAKDREKFWKDYKKKGYKYCVKKYFYPDKIPLKKKINQDFEALKGSIKAFIGEKNIIKIKNIIFKK